MTYPLPKTRTNYGKINIRYQGAKVCNAISDDIKLLSLKKFKGLAKLVNFVAETLLGRQMFPSLAVRETYVAETNFATRKPKLFLHADKNIFVSRTQILRPKHMFPSLAAMKTMLISFQCRSHIEKCFIATASRQQLKWLTAFKERERKGKGIGKMKKLKC